MNGLYRQKKFTCNMCYLVWQNACFRRIQKFILPSPDSFSHPQKNFYGNGLTDFKHLHVHGLWKQKNKNQLTCQNANSISKIKSSWGMFLHLFFSNWLQLHCLFCLICMLSFCCNSSTPKSDKHVTSPNNIHTLLSKQVRWILKLVTNLKGIV